ncbi:MAG TPA: energy-coupling factor transporter transmembrane component T, partial [Anaerolineae bacterium]|nr:energy-coupling factor transporter transmembrane component T [Anaerolineae bacterium]
RFVPSFLYQTGMIASIAIAFVPQMVSSLRDIREAQAIRGHRFRGIRDLLPLFVPLLTTGLERAVQLAESMEARGFGNVGGDRSRARQLVYRLLIACSLFGLLVAAFAYGYWSDSPWASALLGSASLMLLAGTVTAMGRGAKRSRYRHELWRSRDTLVSAVSVVSILVIALFWLLDTDTLFFYPYPRLSWPDFNPLIGAALLAVVTPVLTAPQMRRSASD